jgi:hypothetical protein
MKAISGCYITANGEKRPIVIHYEYALNAQNQLSLISTRYTESDGFTVLELAEGDKIDACCCDGPGDKIGSEKCYGEEGNSSAYSYVNADNTTEGSFSTNSTTIKWQVGGGDGSLDGSIPYIDGCINDGGIATMTIQDTEGNTVVFEADTILSSSATGASYTGTTAGAFSGKINSVNITCSTNTALGGKACAFLQPDQSIKWLDTSTGVELTEEQRDTLRDCEENCVTICPECPEENTQFIVCATESVTGVEINDQILTLTVRDCNGIIVKSVQYNISNENIEITEAVITEPCDPEPDIETIRDCIVDSKGNQWTQVIVIDPDGIEPDQSLFYDASLQLGTPEGEPKEWTACPNATGLVDFEKTCFEFLGESYKGYTFAYSDGEVQFATSLDSEATITGANDFCCDDCIQVFGCRDGRLAWPIGSQVTMVNGDVLDISGLHYSEVAQLIVDTYGGDFNAPSLGGPQGPNFSQCQGSSRHELQFFNLPVDIESIDEMDSYGKFGNCQKNPTEFIDCKKIKLNAWLWNNDNRGCGPVQHPVLPITFFGDWTIDEFTCNGRNVVRSPINISYASWNDNFNEWTNNLNPLINHNLDWVNAGKPCYRVMSTMTSDDTIYGDFKVTLVQANSPVWNARAQGEQVLIQPEVLAGDELEIDVCTTKVDGRVTKQLLDKMGNPIESLITYVAAKYAHIVDATTGAQVFSAANILKIYGSEDAFRECLVDCSHVYPVINTEAPCRTDVSEGGCVYDENGVQVETNISQAILFASNGSIKSRFYVEGIFNEDSNNDVEYIMPEGHFYDRTCTGTKEEEPVVEPVEACIPFEVNVKYPDTKAGCLKATQWMNPRTKEMVSITTIDSVDVIALLDECGIELDYCADCCCECDLTIQRPDCPAFQSSSDNTVFTNDVRYTRGENEGQLVGPFGWEEGDTVTFPLKAGANYLSDFTHCMSIDQSCCLLGLDQSLPVTVRVTFDHEINDGNDSHTGFNINPTVGTVIATSPNNTTAATIGGAEGFREDRWVDIEYTLGDMLNGGACFSTSALGSSNTLGEGPLDDSIYETIYSMNVAISPDFFAQLLAIFDSCPCSSPEGRVVGLQAQANGEPSGSPTDEALKESMTKRNLENPTAQTLSLTGGSAGTEVTDEQVAARAQAVVKFLSIKEDAKKADFQSSKVLSKAVAQKTKTKTKTGTATTSKREI